MKNAFSFVLTAAAVVAASTLTPTPAAAQAFTAAAQGDSCNPQRTSATGSTYTATSATAFGQVVCSSSGLSVTLTAWTAYTTNSSGFVQGNLGDFNASGFGAYTGVNETSANGNHAFDNLTSNCTGGTAAVARTGGTTAGGGSNALTLPTSSVGNNYGCGGAVEALLLNFGSTGVKLSQVSTGWGGTDADLSVYAWTGNSSGPTMGSQTITNDAATGLAGWTLVGSNDMDITGANPFVLTGANAALYSSYFLVTTYFGATSGNLNAGNDAFKIDGWTTNVCAGTVNSSGVCSTTTNVPEPGSLALAGLAMFGMFASRRKVKALF